MGLEDIKKKILSDAEHKKAEILKEAQEKAAAAKSEAEAKVSAYRKTSLENAEVEGESLRRGIVIDAKQKVKNEILAKKREMIEEVFASAISAFTNDASYGKILTDLIASSVSGGKGEVILSSSEKKLNDGWLKDTAKACGADLKFSAEKGKFQGGVIVSFGNEFLNLTAETLLSVMRDELEKGVAEILF